ncbi:MAG: hypothetical protein ABII00_16035 [Elusimicrobiota bacterium]
MKKILIPAAACAVLAGGLLLTVALSLNSIIRSAVVNFGPKLTGGSVSLEEVRISPLSGRGGLKGLVIGNPEGFRSGSAFELDEVRIGVNVRSILSRTVIVDEVFIKGAKVTYEAGLKGSNIGAILMNIESFAGKGAKERPSGSDGPSKKVRIGSFTFMDATLSVSGTILEGRTLSARLPKIHLKDIGGDDGIMPARAVARIFRELTRSIVRAATRGGLRAGETGEDAKKQVQNAIKGLKVLFGR